MAVTIMTIQEIINKIKTLKLNQHISLALNCDDLENAEQWIEIKYLNIMDTNCIMIGGYGYDLMILANPYELEELQHGQTNIIEKLECDISDYIDSQGGTIEQIGISYDF